MERSAELHDALRLSLTRSRSRRAADATVAFKLANDLEPAVARFAYAYALTLKQSGQVAAAVRVLDDFAFFFDVRLPSSRIASEINFFLSTMLL